MCQRLPKWPSKKQGKGAMRFTIYAIWRNTNGKHSPALSLANGLHGVREPGLVKVYEQTIRQAWKFFLKEGRPKPTNELRVYVFATDDEICGAPQMAEVPVFHPHDGLKIVSAIALPSRSESPTLQGEQELACTTVVHELSHFFNASVLPFRKLHPEGGETMLDTDRIGMWLWLDEAMAVDAEIEFGRSVFAKSLPVGKDWLGFALDWVDRPERSLHDRNAVYQAAFFIRYVKRLMANRCPRFFNDVWRMAAREWMPGHWERLTALEAMEQEFQKHDLLFSSTDKPDVFASGYCFDSYFLHQPETLGHEPEIHARYRERAISRTWLMAKGLVRARFSLDPLACRYFRFVPDGIDGELMITITTAERHTFKAELALASRGKRHLVPGSKRTLDRTGFTDGETHTITISSISDADCDHVVLVVSNCSVAPSTPDEPANFTLEFTFHPQTGARDAARPRRKFD